MEMENMICDVNIGAATALREEPRCALCGESIAWRGYLSRSVGVLERCVEILQSRELDRESRGLSAYLDDAVERIKRLA